MVNYRPHPRSRPPGRRSRSRRPSSSSTTWPRPGRYRRRAEAADRRHDRRPSRWPRPRCKRDRPCHRRHHRPCRSRPEAGRAAPLRSGDPGRPALHGQDRAGHQHRLQRRPGLSRGAATHSARSRSPNGAKVAFFSLEMSAEQLAMRILAEHTEISSDRIRRGEISGTTISPRLVAAAQELQTPATSSSTTRPASPCRPCAPAPGA